MTPNEEEAMRVLRRCCRGGWVVAPSEVSNTTLRALAKAGLIEIRDTAVYGEMVSSKLFRVRVR
jgi:hypothetical protein